MGSWRVERALAVVGATALLIVGLEAATYAATGGSLLLGKSNTANSTTTISNTGAGAALQLKVASPSTPPLATNGRGKVANLYADRAARADTLGGLTLGQVRGLPSLRDIALLRWKDTDGSFAMRLSDTAYGFSTPQAVAFDGTNIWVANYNNTVTCLNATTGAVVRVLRDGATAYGFNRPKGLAFDGTNIWVVNEQGNSVTVVSAATGALVLKLSASSYGFDSPRDIAFDGSRMWVANFAGDSLSVVRASDGGLVQIVSGGTYGLTGPSALAFDGTDMWAANYGGNSVTRVRASNRNRVATYSGGSYGFDAPQDIAFDGTRMWIANFNGSTLTVVNANDGALAGKVTGITDAFALAFDGRNMWASSYSGDAVFEYDGSTMQRIRRISGKPYSFALPSAIAFDGSKVWVANASTVSVSDNFSVTAITTAGIE